MSWNLDTKVNNISLQQVKLSNEIISTNNVVSTISGQVSDLSNIIIRSASNPLVISANHNISINDATGSNKGVVFDLLNKNNKFNYSNTFQGDVSCNSRLFVPNMTDNISDNYVFYNDTTGELTTSQLHLAEPLEMKGNEITIRESKVLTPLEGQSGYMSGEQALELTKATADIVSKQDKFEVKTEDIYKDMKQIVAEVTS